MRDTRKADRVTLLDVYRDGYALRLIEVLTTDYPGVLAMAGPADFDHMARAYIAAHPSRHPSVRWYRQGTCRLSRRTAALQTARRTLPRWRGSNGRWARRSTSPDASRSRPTPLMALPPEAWETISFTALPSLRRLTLTFDVPQAWQRRDEVEPGNLEVEPAAEPVAWVDLAARAACPISARSSPTRRRCSMPWSRAGPSPRCAKRCAPFAGEDQAPARAAGLLRAWVEEGMIAGFRTNSLSRAPH